MAPTGSAADLGWLGREQDLGADLPLSATGRSDTAVAQPGVHTGGRRWGQHPNRPRREEREAVLQVPLGGGGGKELPLVSTQEA